MTNSDYYCNVISARPANQYSTT